MQFTKAFLTFALIAAPIFAAPAPAAVAEDGHLESRATYVSCKPKTGDFTTKPFKVDVDNAKKQAKAAGFTAGKSGDPHGYQNHEKIIWGVDDCDNGKNPLFEYMIYWEGAAQKEWKKDTKSKDQEKTPIRVLYAKNATNHAVYCGVAIKSNVDKTFQGSGAFLKC
ncbi:Ribonuclease/ribotoxin [Elaphomyces granulatus]